MTMPDGGIGDRVLVGYGGAEKALTVGVLRSQDEDGGEAGEREQADGEQGGGLQGDAPGGTPDQRLFGCRRRRHIVPIR